MKKLLCLAVLVLASCGVRPVFDPTMGHPPPKVYERQELQSLIGKTPDEVVAKLGKPGRTSDHNGKPDMWTYYSRSLDPVTGKVDGVMFIHFSDGKVRNVNF